MKLLQWWRLGTIYSNSRSSSTIEPFEWTKGAKWSRESRMTASWPTSPILTVTSNNANILVVDDDENTLQLLKITLERACAHVWLATSGPQALRLAFEHHPDILLLDVKMP